MAKNDLFPIFSNYEKEFNRDLNKIKKPNKKRKGKYKRSRYQNEISLSDLPSQLQILLAVTFIVIIIYLFWLENASF